MLLSLYVALFSSASMKMRFFILFVVFLGLVQLKADDADATAVNPLDAIVLPEKASKEDVVKYMKAIRKAVDKEREDRTELLRKTQRTELLYDKKRDIEAKLDAVPTAYIGEMLALAPISLRLVVARSINDRADLSEEQREVIVGNLVKYPYLIKTMVRYGWEKNAEKKVLQAALSDMSSSFVPVLASYGSPESTKVLVKLLTEGSPIALSYNFAALPGTEIAGLDRAAVVAKAWKLAQTATGNGAMYYAPIAAKFGYRDALLYIAKILNGTPDPRDRFEKRLRANGLSALRELVPDGGPDEKSLVEYVLANRATLVFDLELKEYRVPNPPK